MRMLFFCVHCYGERFCLATIRATGFLRVSFGWRVFYFSTKGLERSTNELLTSKKYRFIILLTRLFGQICQKLMSKNVKRAEKAFCH